MNTYIGIYFFDTILMFKKKKKNWGPSENFFWIHVCFAVMYFVTRIVQQSLSFYPIRPSIGLVRVWRARPHYGGDSEGT